MISSHRGIFSGGFFMRYRFIGRFQSGRRWTTLPMHTVISLLSCWHWVSFLQALASLKGVCLDPWTPLPPRMHLSWMFLMQTVAISFPQVRDHRCKGVLSEGHWSSRKMLSNFSLQPCNTLPCKQSLLWSFQEDRRKLCRRVVIPKPFIKMNALGDCVAGDCYTTHFICEVLPSLWSLATFFLWKGGGGGYTGRCLSLFWGGLYKKTAGNVGFCST